MTKNKLNKFVNSKLLIFIFSCLIITIFSLRVINLDRDLPPWGVGYYQPIDEGSYSILSLNHLNHNTIDPSNIEGGLSFYTPSHVRTNIIGNLATYVGLNTLGDNYYGLRLPYVVICFLNLILIAMILFQLRKKYGLNNISEIWILLGCLFYLSIDFQFTLASRVVEPSTVRLLFVLFTIYIFLLLEKKPKAKFFLLGLIISTSVFAVYITNVFMLLAVGLILLFIWKQDGFMRFFQLTCFFALGCFTALGICELYYIIFWKTEAIMNMFGALFDFSSVNGYSSAYSIRTLCRTIIRFFASNSLFYNYSFLLCAIFVLPIMIRRVLVKKDTNVLFMLSIIVSFFLQTLASEDYIIRKSIIIYPVFIFLFYLGYLYYKDWESLQKNIDMKIIMQDNTDSSAKANRRGRFKNKLLYFIQLYKAPFVSLLISLIVIIVILAYRIILCNPEIRSDYDIIDKLVFILCLFIPVLSIMIYLIWNLMKKNELNKKKFSYIIGIIFTFSFITNTYLSLKYIYLNPTFSEKSIMVELQKDAGNSLVLGEYENGFTLYNNIRPVLNTYDQLKMYMESNNNLLYFDYYDDYDYNMRHFFDNIIFKDSEKTVIPIKSYNREFQTYGVKKRMALYKIVTKKEASQYYFAYYKELKEKDSLSADEDKIIDKLKNNYQDVKQSITSDIAGADVYVDIYGNIEGSIYSDIYGTIYGDISGNIYGMIYGDIYGDISGNVYGDIKGKLYGEMKGKYYLTEKEKENSNAKN